MAALVHIMKIFSKCARRLGLEYDLWIAARPGELSGRGGSIFINYLEAHYAVNIVICNENFELASLLGLQSGES